MVLAILVVFLWPHFFAILAVSIASAAKFSWDTSYEESPSPLLSPRQQSIKKIVLGVVAAVLYTIMYLAYLGFILEPGRSIANSVKAKLMQSWPAYVEQNARDLAKENVTRTDLGVEVKRYKLIAYNPPKHFYVTLQSVQDHVIFKSVYVSKHCNNYSQNEIGAEYNLEVMKYTLSTAPDQVQYEFRNLYQAFCS